MSKYKMMFLLRLTILLIVVATIFFLAFYYGGKPSMPGNPSIRLII